MKIFTTLFIFIFTFNSFTQNSSNLNLDKKKLAVDGYDLVTYFDNNPQEGNQSIKYFYENAHYYFVNKKNRELFKKSPSKYLPQYGGWCAYAMGDSGEQVEIDPETYKIIDDKLYLFYNKYFTNTLKSWNKKEAALKRSADKNWLKFVVK
ncbi:MAG: YHS domain-containing (seleno)protein [Flavobacteriaceae bacterium]